MELSIIIPTLNEAENIGRLLDFLQEHTSPDQVEILVVDANSEDQTAQLAQAKGARVLNCLTRSRAAQMNLGAAQARGTVLYFVHADAIPPADFFQAIQEARSKGICMGCFRYRFDRSSWLLRCNAWFTRFSFLWCQGGDKTLFILASVFEELGAYDESYVIMEEYHFIQRARKKYIFPTLPQVVTVSARKYHQRSWLRVQLANLLVFNLFRFGMNPIRLKMIYKRMLN